MLDATLRAARPARMAVRDYTYALFDVGATHCRARPVCAGCPLHAECVWHARGPDDARAVPRPPRQGAYAGSLRQLRGAVLAEALRTPGAPRADLVAAVATVPGATPDRIRSAIDGLVADGLIPGDAVARR